MTRLQRTDEGVEIVGLTVWSQGRSDSTHVVTLPRDVVRLLGIEAGDRVSVRPSEGRIDLRTDRIDSPAARPQTINQTGNSLRLRIPTAHRDEWPPGTAVRLRLAGTDGLSILRDEGE